MGALLELRLADLMTLLAVQRTGTISGAARELRVTPSQVSKAVSRLERLYRVRLLSRGARGVAPTPAARRMLPRIANAVEELRATSGAREEEAPEIELSVAGPAYLMSELMPRLATEIPRVRMRTFEMLPALVRASVAENVFDMALVPGGMPSRPAAWTTDPVGELRSGLLARPIFVKRLGPLPLTPDRVRALPFVGPTQTGGDRFVAASDDCPLRPEERTIAHEVQTIASALEFVSRTDYVVFGPVAAARRHIENGTLREIPVAGWDVTEVVHLACNGDRVLARVRAAATRAARETLEPLGSGLQASASGVRA
jgi:DNA-binding transcriptional LysR family regulator